MSRYGKKSIEVPEFEAASRETTFSPGIGFPGRVWFSREPTYIPDVVHDADFRVRLSPRTKDCMPPSGFPFCSAAKFWESWSSSAKRSGSRTRTCST